MTTHKATLGLSLEFSLCVSELGVGWHLGRALWRGINSGKFQGRAHLGSKK